MNPDDSSKIERLKKSLYSRTAPDVRSKRRFRFNPLTPTIATDWEHESENSEEVVLNKKYEDHTMSFLTKLLIGSILFFIAALGIGAYLVFNGSNIVSANNIDILVNGPLSVAGGDPVSFDIQISNKNNVKLETVDLSIDFPSGTVDPDDTTKSLTNFRQLISDIEPGGMGQKTIRAVLYGEENTKKNIEITVEYRVKNSNAVYQKKKTFDVLMSSSPITLSVDSYKEVTAGQEFEMEVSMKSNSKEVIKNILFKAVYPFGFNFISSDIKPLADNATWKVGDIPPGGKKVIKIKGKLEGQDDETRVFRFVIGSSSVRNDKVIGTEYITSTQDVTIKKPFISVGVEIDGEETAEDQIVEFNKSVPVKVTWFNNLDTSVLDGEIRVKLSGSALDKGSIDAGEGLYRASTNEIVWDSKTTPELSNIGAGESGNIRFTLVPRDLSNSSQLVLNPSIDLSVGVKGNRSSENNVSEVISTSAVRKMKVSSALGLTAQVLRNGGAFENTGPIPPKVDQMTTYTVVWTVDNSSNVVSNMEISSSLPAYAKWMGKISPSSEDISYNSVDGQIVWKTGNVGTYTAQNSKRRQVSFQVGITPSLTHVGNALDITKQTEYRARDEYTGETLSGRVEPLSTRFSTDQTYKDGDEKVVQ